MSKRPILLLLAGLAVLPACGQRSALRPAEGAGMPPKPALAPRARTVEQLLTAPVEARPGRSDETLKRPEERHDDRFDLPPPG